MQSLLHEFWQQTQLTSKPSSQPASPKKNWHEQIRIIQQCGKGIEEALHFLYRKQPSYEAFLQWLNFKEGTYTTSTVMDDVLTTEDLSFWNTNGYLVIKNAVPANQCAAARQAIWEFLQANPADPSSWYSFHEGKNGLMLSFFNHPALEANRNSPIIRKAYEQIYGHTNIYRSTDKVSFNPPETEDFKFQGCNLHWDVSLQLPIPFKLQGLLYLTDVDAEAGAFYCVPGFHKTIDHWLNSLPEGINPREEAVKQLQPLPITGKAGDFIIWHQALPHCATPNHGTMPRLVQYVTYKPVNVADQEIWK